MKITVATSQFPTSADILTNARYIKRQMSWASKLGADVVHFPECSLCGYAGSDLENYDNLDWSLLKESTLQIMDLARELKIWVILGSVHRLSDGHKPHDSLYIIDDSGRIKDRYDKLFCAGNKEQTSGDLAHYSPGNHFSTFKINGVKCGTLICHDFRYPELYRKYKKMGVELMFHSFHAGHVSPTKYENIKEEIGSEFLKLNVLPTIAGITQIAAMQASSSNNYMYVSCPNTSARISCWPAFFVRPDGVITGRLRLHRPGLLITKVDTSHKFYDSTVVWRRNAINNVFHSGTLVKDKRSENRTEL